MKNNKLLQRQIKRYLPAECAANPALVPFLQAVAASYYAFDRDSLLSARAFKMSEEEYLEVNDKLQKELELKKISIHKLKAAIMETDVEGFSLDGDDLLEIMDLLNAQISKRKQSEAELKASQELWQFALEGAGDGVWDYDFQTNKIFFKAKQITLKQAWQKPKKAPGEIWIMFKDVKKQSEGPVRKIISAWRYPGISKPGEAIPVPEDIKLFLKSGIME